MLNSDPTDVSIKPLPDERRLLRQARSGNADAFIRLYDAYVERVYQYIYFRVSDDVAAESITSRVFVKAWESLVFHPILLPSFFFWLCRLARKQVTEYYRTHQRIPDLDPGFVLVTGDSGTLDERVQDIFDLQAMRDALQFLSEEQRQVLILKYIAGLPAETIARIMVRREATIRSLEVSGLQVLARIEAKKDVEHWDFKWILEDCLGRIMEGTSTAEECLRKNPEYAVQLRPLLRTVLFLNLARTVKPSATFSASLRDSLTDYLRFHGRQPHHLLTLSRIGLASFVVLAALLITGTARAQSAMPGDLLYGWKRTSEQVWRAASIDPVATDLMIANRRVDEWLVTRHHPDRSASALDGYSEVITRLEASQNVETLVRVVPVVETHKRILEEAGLSDSNLGNYVNSELATLPVTGGPQPQPPALQGPAVQPTAIIVIPPTAQPTTASSEPEPLSVPTQAPPPTSVIIPVPPTGTPVFIPPVPAETAVEVVPPSQVPSPPSVSPPSAVPTEKPPEPPLLPGSPTAEAPPPD